MIISYTYNLDRALSSICINLERRKVCMNADSAQAGAAFDDSLVAQITTLLNGETLANFNYNTVYM